MAFGFLAVVLVAKIRSPALLVSVLLFLCALCASAFGFFLRSSAARASLVFLQFAEALMKDSRPLVFPFPRTSIDRSRCRHTSSIAPGPGAFPPPAFSRRAL